jgi:hypothetical protein
MMRCRRMRGYGAWCMGWREGERKTYRPSNNDPGFGSILFYGFLVLVALTFFKVALETGNGLGILFGIAIIAGMLKGRS